MAKTNVEIQFPPKCYYLYKFDHIWWFYTWTLNGMVSIGIMNNASK